MTGLRREIAKHVVLNILETLNENDFVNVFNFSVETVELVPCFNDTLVQVREVEKALLYVRDISCFRVIFLQVRGTGDFLLYQGMNLLDQREDLLHG